MFERRMESEGHYRATRSQGSVAWDNATGWLSFRRSKSPVPTIELDEDSYFAAYNEWNTPVAFALGRYAREHAHVVATVYTYSTGPAPSVNSSHGASHQKNGWHNACFFGVVGKTEILDFLKDALAFQRYVPQSAVQANLKDETQKTQVYCDYSPDYIQFKPGWRYRHVEDGRVWAPDDEDFCWYTDKKWQEA